MKLKVLTLNKETWFRGEGCGEGKLRFPDGKMCCLGFLALACGISKKAITGKDMPCQLGKNQKKLPEQLVAAYNEEEYDTASNEFALNVAEVNDRSETDDNERIRALRPYFQSMGYRLQLK